MSTPVPLTDVDVLPNHEKIIRNAIKEILTNEPRLKDLRGWHNVPTGTDFNAPYGYVMFNTRIPIPNDHDIGFWQYRYNFQIGVVTEFKSTDEDALDDLALDYINLIESALQKQEAILLTTDLFFYDKTLESQSYNLLPNMRHYSLKIGFTQNIPIG